MLRAQVVMLLLWMLSSTACATRTVRFNNECFNVSARLDQAWATLQAARSDPAGCLGGPNGADRCQQSRSDIEYLSHVCPSDQRALMANAILAYDARDLAKAQQLLDVLFSLQRIYPEAAVLRARIALEEGNTPFAVRFLTQAVRTSSDHAGLREVYASSLYLSGRWDEAGSQLMAAERLGAPRWRIAYHRGLIEEARHNLEAAHRYYAETLKANPSWKPAASRLKGLTALIPPNAEGSPSQTP